MTMGGTSSLAMVCEVCFPRLKHGVSEETVLKIRNNSQIIHKYVSFIITDNTPSSKSTILHVRNWNRWMINMVAIPRDKINYPKASKYVNNLIFKEFYPETKNLSHDHFVDQSEVQLFTLRRDNEDLPLLCSGTWNNVRRSSFRIT